jgi:hypothetical protein
VQTQIADTVTRQDLVLDMHEIARTLTCGVVVVGRESLHGLQALVTSHGSDTLMRQAHGLTVWVVE